jgi:hypothetical protein
MLTNLKEPEVRGLFGAAFPQVEERFPEPTTGLKP